MSNKTDKELLEIYKQFIIQHHGQPALDRLDLEFAVIRTNNLLNVRDAKQFDNIRRAVAEDYSLSLK